MKILKMISVGVLITAMLMGCSKNAVVKNTTNEIPKYENEKYVHYVSEKDIKTDVETLNKKYKGVFTKYIQYIAPNGKPITILAQDKVEDEMLLNSYNILSFYLTSNSDYDKTALANKIAETGNVIVMPNGKDGDKDGRKASNFGQPVYQLEAPTIGGKWYINNNYEHRDAAYEEIFHFVHDSGIGTASNKGVMPELQQEIYKATMTALPKEKSAWGKEGTWGLNSKDWLLELEKEGSLEQEYMASVIDVYYGLWEPWKDGKGGMWGIYAYKTKDELVASDTLGHNIVKKFLGPDLTFMARIDPSFTGTFKLTLDENEPYTHKSQHYVNVRLTGTSDSNITGNDKDNIFMGNSGKNLIDGLGGNDTVQFTGASTEYTIELVDGKTVVRDTLNRDGTNELMNIELLRFTDKDIEIK